MKLNEPTFIPPDIYRAECIHYKTYRQYGGHKKLCLEWKIELMNGQTVVLPQHFNLNHKCFKDSSKYGSDWIIANNYRKPIRRTLKFMTPKIFIGVVAEVIIETVVPKFQNGQEKHEIFHYSKVQNLLSFIERKKCELLT